MKLLKVFSVLVALTGLAALAIVVAPAVYGQRTVRPVEPRGRALEVLTGRGASIGVVIRDVVPAEAGGDRSQDGVLVDRVTPDSPAEKAGVKAGDVIVQFDGERVRSARQFTRLVQETTPGRSVKATVVRDGKRSELQVTPDERRGDVMVSGDFGRYFGDLGRDIERWSERLPEFNFNFDWDGIGGGRRLGVTIDELTPQLAEYFGAKDGLLVTSVTSDTPAARAGLKAGDVIISIDGRAVDSRDDLLRGIRDARDDTEVTIGIVRDKKESSVKARIEQPRRAPRGRPA